VSEEACRRRFVRYRMRAMGRSDTRRRHFARPGTVVVGAAIRHQRPNLRSTESAIAASIAVCSQSRANRASQRAADLLSVIRLHVGSWFALLGLLGAAPAAGLRWTSSIYLTCYAIALSCMGFTVNNIADRNRDTFDRRRSPAPIVTSRITVHGALVIAVAFELVAVGSVVLTAISTGCRVLALALSFLVIVGSAYQRVLGRVALLADLIFGIGMGLEVLLGRLWVSSAVDSKVLLLVVAVSVQMTMLSVTAGSLKDVDADLTSPKATTTAVSVGARPSPDGGRALPTRYGAGILGLQVCSFALVIAVALAEPEEPWSIARRALAIFGAAASVAATFGLYRLAGRLRPGSRGRNWYLFVNLAALLLADAANESERTWLLVGGAFLGALAWQGCWIMIAAWLANAAPEIAQ
jgi:4-hydroxybenzoate polyprenyltransferase